MQHRLGHPAPGAVHDLHAIRHDRGVDRHDDLAHRRIDHRRVIGTMPRGQVHRWQLDGDLFAAPVECQFGIGETVQGTLEPGREGQSGK